MHTLLLVLVGCVIGGGITAIYQHLVHGSRRKADEYRYKEAWSAAIDKLLEDGKLTDAQFKRILPRLREGEGFSQDRAKIEIARAKAGLPPADNLANMFSDDRAAVELARIENGTALHY